MRPGYAGEEFWRAAVPVARRYPEDIDRRDRLSAPEFYAEYVAQGRPVVVPGALARCPALALWSFDHLRRVSGERMFKLKYGLDNSGVRGLRTVAASLHAYLDQLQAYEAAGEPVSERPPYLHDIPLLSILPEALTDLDGFPSEYFPDWYRSCWAQFAQFFLGPKHSLTPLHFDCLLTHNLFFQVSGYKRFILLDHSQLHRCYPYRWRWCAVDPEHPDDTRHPLYREACVSECTVGPGDMLYMPPGMLHHVRGLASAVSFNVDWHTPASSLRGVLALGRGMPLKNVYYNAVIALGQNMGVSARRVLPWYRSYLNYVS